MNLFVVFRKPDGTLELVTPPLDGMILPGVTRDSVLQLAQSHAAGTINIPELTDKLVVSERNVTMKEVKDAAMEGRLVELFGSGGSSFSALPLYPLHRPFLFYFILEYPVLMVSGLASVFCVLRFVGDRYGSGDQPRKQDRLSRSRRSHSRGLGRDGPRVEAYLERTHRSADGDYP